MGKGLHTGRGGPGLGHEHYTELATVLLFRAIITVGMNLESELGNFPVISFLNLDTMCVGLASINKL